MTATRLSLNTSITTRLQIIELRAFNAQTIDSPSLDAVVETALPLRAIEQLIIYGLESSGTSVFEAVIKVTYDEDGVPDFDWMASRDSPCDFVMSRGDERIRGPQRAESGCSVWRDVAAEYMRVCKRLGLVNRWAVCLSGPHAQEVRDQHGLIPSDIVRRATKQIGSDIANSEVSGLRVGLLIAPEFANQQV